MSGCVVKKHGMFGTRLYDVWAGMHKRCRGTSGIEHKRRYHDRGIRVCKEWREFVPFMKWALANGYNEHLTIDRKDNDGHYSPTNCQFSDAIRQANNRSSSRWITFDSQTKTLREWEKSLGFHIGIIADRLRRGWSTQDAITTPQKQKKTITYKGRTQTISEWAAELNIPNGVLQSRICRHGPTDEVMSMPCRRKT
jgi:hypothetical protein